MKHHFSPWSTERPTTGFGSLAIQPGDAIAKCTHCGVNVKIAAGQSTTKFWVAGGWTTERPPCGGRDRWAVDPQDEPGVVKP